MKQILQYIPPYFTTIVVFIAICYLSLAPDPMPEENRWLDFAGADKVVHFMMYCTLCVTFCFDYYRHNKRPHNSRIIIPVAGIAATLIGGFIEILQYSMQLGRSGDIIDFIADTLGVCTGLFTGIMIFSRKKQ